MAKGLFSSEVRRQRDGGSQAGVLYYMFIYTTIGNMHWFTGTTTKNTMHILLFADMHIYLIHTDQRHVTYK